MNEFRIPKGGANAGHRVGVLKWGSARLCKRLLNHNKCFFNFLQWNLLLKEVDYVDVNGQNKKELGSCTQLLHLLY